MGSDMLQTLPAVVAGVIPPNENPVSFGAGIHPPPTTRFEARRSKETALHFPLVTFLPLSVFFPGGFSESPSLPHSKPLHMMTTLPRRNHIAGYASLLFFALVFAGLLNGCTGPYSSRLRQSPPPDENLLSLFDGDNPILTEEAIARMLSTPVKLPDNAHIAVLQMPGKSFDKMYYYSSITEDEQRIQRENLDSINTQLKKSGIVAKTSSLPSLLIPAEPTIPVLREIAVRLQADMLLVYRINGDLFRNYRIFSKDQYKAYSTCEAVLIDVRTGTLPFTTVTTTEYLTVKQSTDINDDDARRRAEQQAITNSVNGMADSVAVYLRTLR